MNIETKVLLVRIAAVIGLCFFSWLGWWMDYRWKRSPFYKKEKETRLF